jgi:UDP-glucose 4-epimerase
LNIVITGGCGFIGVNLIYQLLQQKKHHQIRVVDNITVGKRQYLRAVKKYREIAIDDIGKTLARELELIVGDVRDKNLALLACRDADCIIHLAANTGVVSSIKDPMADCTSNVVGTLNYLEAARIAMKNKVIKGAKNNRKRNNIKFLFASSGAPLGIQKKPIHEKVVPRPISPYGASKLAGEAYCNAYHGSFALDAVVLRFSNVYGPRSVHKGSVVAKFARQIIKDEPLTIYGDGNQSRDFIYVEDLVKAIILALESTDTGGEIFQIASNKEHKIKYVAELINSIAKEKLNKKSKIIYKNERKGEVRKNCADISKAKKMLKFKPKYSLKEGLESTLLWFLNECF